MKLFNSEKAVELNLTKLEERFLSCFIENLYAEEGFSDVTVSDIAEGLKESTRKMRGVASSLIKKDIIFIEDMGQFQIVYLNDDYYHLHKIWGAIQEDELKANQEDELKAPQKNELKDSKKNELKDAVYVIEELLESTFSNSKIQELEKAIYTIKSILLDDHDINLFIKVEKISNGLYSVNNGKKTYHIEKIKNNWQVSTEVEGEIIHKCKTKKECLNFIEY